MKAVSLKRMEGLESKLIEAYPTVDFVFTKGVSEIEEQDKQDLDILFGYDGKLDQTFLENCPNLKWIAWYSTGVNSLPLDYIVKRNILLTNGKGIHAKQMSEFIIAYILDDYKKMRTSYINQQNRYYDSKLTGTRVNGKTILFLGTGSIAQYTANIANAMNMKVTGINTNGHSVEGFCKTFALNDLSNALTEADIIVNTLPETEQTTHLITKAHFELMDESALFINVGRGTIVDESVIIEALKEKYIRHAYLDVFEKEPLNPGNELYSLDNVTITAHITGNGKENMSEATDIFSNNLAHFLNKKDLIENVVDPKQGY
ncbi:phosphoglycerate dehydrogenase [Staphylococcus equorum]|uniref:Phosphoglycerate dehydrogenase n=1 Tax=Staphylococcus equorum TaxID=246432 RepID=A0A9X4R5Z1_9STAP|nr:phosphoglycerate dehydrogenase [Staphylococcus equorum]MDG0844594.1 phosphoglycerate dehydrogenase [Staphylococcus equorum]MDG0860833.1 phosphoglycerate dehydrogenase [Staphylococcus equorum]